MDEASWQFLGTPSTTRLHVKAGPPDETTNFLDDQLRPAQYAGTQQILLNADPGFRQT